MRISICVRVYSGIRMCTIFSGLTCGTPGDRGECFLPFLFTCHDFPVSLAAGSVFKQRNNTGPWSRACTGHTVNIVRRYNRCFQ